MENFSKYLQVKVIFVLIAFLSNVGLLLAQSSFLLNKKEAQEDLDCLQNALEYIHPRLYKYTDKPTKDALFEQASDEIRGSISSTDLLRLVSKINAQVNCGHLYTIPQFELGEEIQNKQVMPFFIRFIEEELHLWNDCSLDNPLPNGSKIISINGKPSKAIIKTIKEGIAADGYIETRKNRLLERYISTRFHGFDLYYYLHVDRSQNFSVEYQIAAQESIKTKAFSGIHQKERKRRLLEKYQVDQDQWYKTASPSFRIEQNYAVLSLTRSFFDPKVDPDFDPFLSNAFQKIREKNIGHLILDLRNNEGGSEHHAIELMSYLYDQPFKLYQNIYLSHLDYRPLKSYIIERDSQDLVFNNDDQYMRKFSQHLWINNYEYSRSLRLQVPKENVFTGKLYVLINGITFSSAADLAAALRKNTDALFIGEESGGTFEGPTGGTSIVIQLPNSKIMVRISPQIHVSSGYKKHEFGRGVFPDYEIEYTVRNLLQQKDLELEKALELIKGAHSPTGNER